MRPAQKEQFFHQVSHLVASGISVQRALEHLASGRGAVAAAAKKLLFHDGGLAERANAEGRLFDALDIGMIEAGERSGDLPSLLDLLAAFYARLAAARARILAKSAYPFFLFQLTVVLLSIPPAVFSRDLSVFFIRVGIGLGVFYGILFFLAVSIRLVAMACASYPVADRLFFLIPCLGPARQNYAAARFASVLALQVRAGIGILRALPAAARAAGSALLRIEAETIVSKTREGGTLSDAFAAAHAFPEVLEEAIRIGEASGRLDSELLRAAELLRAKLERSIDVLSEWLPRLFYLVVVAFVAWQILGAAASYYSGLQSIFEDL